MMNDSTLTIYILQKGRGANVAFLIIIPMSKRYQVLLSILAEALQLVFLWLIQLLDLMPTGVAFLWLQYSCRISLPMPVDPASCKHLNEPK